MSVRLRSTCEPPRHGPNGSLFGSAIESPSGGFWTNLAVSPPRTPTTDACKYAPLPPEFQLERPIATAQMAYHIDSVFPSWLHRFDDAVFITFHQQPGVVTLRASPRLACTNMVHASKVRAESVGWCPLACDEPGKHGHLFTLAHGGMATCKIEVTSSGDEITRIVIVQPEYSPVSLASGMVPESSLLVLDDLRCHIDSLARLKGALVARDDTGYVPVREMVATSGFGALVLTTDYSQEGFEARRCFKRVQVVLSELSNETADCIDAYNRSELDRVSQSVADVVAWRKSL